MQRIINAFRRMLGGKSRNTHHAAALLVDSKHEPEVPNPLSEAPKRPEPEPESLPDIVYELPVVPVIKRKSKTRSTTKHTRKTRNKMTRRTK